MNATTMSFNDFFILLAPLSIKYNDFEIIAGACGESGVEKLLYLVDFFINLLFYFKPCGQKVQGLTRNLIALPAICSCIAHSISSSPIVLVISFSTSTSPEAI